MRLYSGRGRRLSGRKGGKRLSGGGKRLCAGGKSLVSAVGLLAVVGGLGALVWCVQTGFPLRPARQAPDDSVQQVQPLHLSAGSRQEGEEGAAWSVEVPEPEDPVLQADRFVLSFAGDCTLGAEHDTWSRPGNFPDVVGEDYAYPLAGVASLFGSDDFTFVNLECALTDGGTPADKLYRFHGLPAYGQILTEGSVEGVSLANNHSLDYGSRGLADTRQVLRELGIAAGGDGETFLYTTDRGLNVGVYTAYHLGRDPIRQGIASLREAGADVVIAAFHSGTEGSYTPTDNQKSLFRYAIDCGADIVYNAHPHVLQPLETYGDGVIFYSLGNFCFGGNRNPTDKDTAVIQVTVERTEDGTVRLAQVEAIPYSVSSRSDRNDYQPTRYPEGSAGADRVARKLAGTYRPPVSDPVPQADSATVQTIAATEASDYEMATGGKGI